MGRSCCLSNNLALNELVGLGLFEISDTKKTKLLGILEENEIFGLSLISESWPIVNCLSSSQVIKGEILR